MYLEMLLHLNSMCDGTKLICQESDVVDMLAIEHKGFLLVVIHFHQQ
jgi:hypothetical protein